MAIITLIKIYVSRYATLIQTLSIFSIAFFLLTPVLAPLLVILIPSDVLVRRRKDLKSMRPIPCVLYMAWHVVKNVLGLTLAVLGFLLLFLPGQGLLTLFAGTLLLDLPGKRRLLSRLLGSGQVRKVIDKLRRRFKRDVLIYPSDLVPPANPADPDSETAHPK